MLLYDYNESILGLYDPDIINKNDPRYKYFKWTQMNIFPQYKPTKILFFDGPNNNGIFTCMAEGPDQNHMYVEKKAIHCAQDHG